MLASARRRRRALSAPGLPVAAALAGPGRRRRPAGGHPASGRASALAALLGRWPRLALRPLDAPLPQLRHRLPHASWPSSGTTCCSSAACWPPSCPRDRASPAVHLLFRMVLFKLYFESGLAKWQSPIGDWHDGSAMAFYYETAPLPTWLGFYAHNLPAWWHHVESRAALALELVVPFAIFGPAAGRGSIAAAAFTAVPAHQRRHRQLRLLLLPGPGPARLPAGGPGRGPGPRAVGARLPAALAARLRRRPAAAPAAGRRLAVPPGWRRRLRRGPRPRWAWAPSSGSRCSRGWSGSGRRAAWSLALRPLERSMRPAAPGQHLPPVRLGHPRADRAADRGPQRGGQWREHDLRYKPGDPGRRPPFVAPHQPRVDFLLWFHGLSWQRPPAYLGPCWTASVSARRPCSALFAGPLPDRPEAVRVAYHRYRFTTVAERRATRRAWHRSLEGRTGDVTCARWALRRPSGGTR